MSTLSILGTSLLSVGVALALAWKAVAGSGAEPVPSDWQDHTLSNGIAVTIVVAPDSPRQHFFSMLPHGLLTDAAGKCQFAHLIEHMCIRATDPDGLEAAGMTMNGETTGLMLRLDTYSEPDHWPDAIRKQGRWVEEWITAETLEEDVLQREKGRIEGEEKSTTSGGFTHKWADAAWAQVVRHGQETVRLHGDVVDATIESIREYAEQQLRTAAGVRLVSIGPADAEEVLKVIEESFGSLDTAPMTAPAATVPAEQMQKPASHEASWDLPTSHYVEWYPLPDADIADRMAGLAVGQLLMIGLSQSPMTRQGVHLLAAPDLVTPEGRWMKISGNLPDGVTVEQVQSAIRQAIDQAQSSGPMLNAMAGQLSMQFTQMLDLSALREMYAARGMANDYLEGNAVLGLVNLEWMTGATRDELIAASGAIDAEQLLEIMKSNLALERRSSLVLRPAP